MTSAGEWGTVPISPSPARRASFLAPGSSAPPTSPASSFYLLQSWSRGAWRGMVTQPNSSPQWKNPVTCPPGNGTRVASASGRAESHTVFKVLLSFTCWKIKDWTMQGAPPIDTVDLQSGYESQRPEVVRSLHAPLRGQCPCVRLIAAAQAHSSGHCHCSGHQHLSCPSYKAEPTSS